MIQTVTLVFEDGTEATFSGPAIIYEGEVKKLVSVYFGEPYPMPNNCSWERLKFGDN